MASPWPNLVERFFRDFCRPALLGSSFDSVPGLLDSIWPYLAEHPLPAADRRKSGQDAVRSGSVVKSR
jgi:hypothetical protein